MTTETDDELALRIRSQMHLDVRVRSLIEGGREWHIEYARRLFAARQGEQQPVADSLERRKKEWADLEVAIKTYSSDYEYGDEGYTPTDFESELAYDFVHGLISDDAFVAAIAQVYPVRAKHAAPIAPSEGDARDCVIVPTWLPAVVDELDRAVKKFPTWPTDPLHALSVLGEEFGELTKATLQLTYEPHKSSMKEFRTEALQTAAMALRFVRSLDAYQFTRCEQHDQDAMLAASKKEENDA